MRKELKLLLTFVVKVFIIFKFLLILLLVYPVILTISLLYWLFNWIFTSAELDLGEVLWTTFGILGSFFVIFVGLWIIREITLFFQSRKPINKIKIIFLIITLLGGILVEGVFVSQSATMIWWTTYFGMIGYAGYGMAKDVITGKIVEKATSFCESCNEAKLKNEECEYENTYHCRCCFCFKSFSLNNCLECYVNNGIPHYSDVDGQCHLGL